MVIEQYFEHLFLAGLIALIAGCVWMVVAAFGTHWKWGVGVCALPPLAFWFATNHPRRGLPPLALIVLGTLGMSIPVIVTRIMPVDLGPFESTVDGERHLTLTGWDRKDYSVLKAKADTVVLQMANADVTDATLDDVAGMALLKELDLSDTQVTDAGLAKLAQLEKLEALRLANCKITDEGLRTHLWNHPALKRLDLTGTPVTPECANEWKSLNPQRRVMQ